MSYVFPEKLRHDNLVNMIEVFRRRKRFYLVFEYLDHTLLDELEAVGTGLGIDASRRHMFQVLRGLNYCHMNHVSLEFRSMYLCVGSSRNRT